MTAHVQQKRGCHKHNLVKHSQDSSHNVKAKHHERLPYGVQSHNLQVVAIELKARWRHLFLGRGPWFVQEKVEEYPLGSKLHFNAVLFWICGLRLWQNVDLEGSHIDIFHPSSLLSEQEELVALSPDQMVLHRGINLVLSNSSSGCKRWPMLGIVLAT